MEIVPDLADAYRKAHHRKLMVLTDCKNDAPKLDDYCRVRSVETLAPDLWITVTFLDGAVKSFRPGKIRLTTPDEATRANELTAASV